MNTAEFDRIVAERMRKIGTVLSAKAKEYARGDRLSNFKRAAAMLNCTPESALVGMMAKHWVSILDMVDDVETGQLNPPAAWDEKIGDAINYLVLMEGLIIERHMRFHMVSQKFYEIPIKHGKEKANGKQKKA